MEVALSIRRLFSPTSGFYEAASSLKHILNMWNVFTYIHPNETLHRFLIKKFQDRYLELAVENDALRATLIQHLRNETMVNEWGSPEAAQISGSLWRELLCEGALEDIMQQEADLAAGIYEYNGRIWDVTELLGAGAAMGGQAFADLLPIAVRLMNSEKMRLQMKFEIAATRVRIADCADLLGKYYLLEVGWMPEGNKRRRMQK